MTTEEIKQQAHKEFEDVIEHLPTLDNSRNLNNKWKKKFLFLIDSLIDKTVQMTEERIRNILDDCLTVDINPSNEDQRMWYRGLGREEAQREIREKILRKLSLITNKSDINNLTE